MKMSYDHEPGALSSKCMNDISISSTDEYKLQDVTMSTDDVVMCYQKKVTQIFDRPSAKRYFHVNIGVL